MLPPDPHRGRACSGQVTAIIPLKALATAKGRLAAELDPDTRRALAGWMFGRVVAACREAASVRDVLVVAGDQAAAAMAREWDLRVLVEPRPGLTPAMAAADAATSDAPATLVVAADLPLSGAEDLDAVCAAGRVGPCVVVAPTRDGGTGALYRCPPAAIRTRYGPGSAAAHLRLAARAGVRAILLEVAALALDIDTPDQLREAADLDRTVRRWARALGGREAGWQARTDEPLPGQALTSTEGATTGCRKAL